nr:alpha/beta fold hydrolase [Branchiibius sp. NY16-3462-2]
MSPGTSASPAVLLLHGTASERDEVGRLFVRLSESLAAHGIASLRIDFAGCGASSRPQTDFTVTSELEDAAAALTWLRAQPSVAADRVAVLGMSQGGMIALLLAASDPSVAGLVTWSAGVLTPSELLGAFPGLLADGAPSAVIDLGYRTFEFSRQWLEEFRAMDLAAAAARLTAPVLAVCGSADTVVLPAASARLVEGVPHRTLVEIPDVDHIFNVLSPSSAASRLLAVTTDWLVATLAR